MPAAHPLARAAGNDVRAVVVGGARAVEPVERIAGMSGEIGLEGKLGRVRRRFVRYHDRRIEADHDVVFGREPVRPVVAMGATVVEPLTLGRLTDFVIQRGGQGC